VPVQACNLIDSPFTRIYCVDKYLRFLTLKGAVVAAITVLCCVNVESLYARGFLMVMCFFIMSFLAVNYDTLGCCDTTSLGLPSLAFQLTLLLS
jgi:hypothetical protein